MKQSFSALVRGFFAAVLFAGAVTPCIAQSPTSPEVMRGVQWLAAQLQADGSLLNESQSIATQLQSRSEAAVTLKLLAMLPASLGNRIAPKDGSDDQPPKGGGRNAQANWKGKPRSNDTHASTTDPDARLYKKSDKLPALLCYQGHVLMENRSGLVVGAIVSHADGMGERANALRLLDSMPGRHPKTVGTDKAYDTRDFVADCRARIEEHFGWAKTVGRIRQTLYRGLQRVDQHFKLTMTASNLTRMARILFAVPQGAAQ